MTRPRFLTAQAAKAWTSALAAALTTGSGLLSSIAVLGTVSSTGLVVVASGSLGAALTAFALVYAVPNSENPAAPQPVTLADLEALRADLAASQLPHTALTPVGEEPCVSDVTEPSRYSGSIFDEGVFDDDPSH